jgi:aspartate carbamoyltransferase catalytic subunit
MTRDLVSISDLDDDEVVALLDRASEFAAEIRAQAGRRRDAILATLFLEPSTRTRLSFEAAMLRLGGRVVTSADPKSSSSSKGETLADTVRMVDAYADVIVLRHPAAGAARLAADVADVPVVNAGDGGREHPTQTLVDLFTLRRRFGRWRDLLVVLWGDLRYGRTTHSLAEALLRFGARVLLLAEPGLEFPATTVAALRGHGFEAADLDVRGADDLFAGGALRGVLLGRGLGAPTTLDLDRDRPDAIYVTRVQAERLPGGVGATRRLPTVDARFLARRAFAETAILHPLPRVGEISPEIDSDPRALYFVQAAAGVPVRMALLDAVLSPHSRARRSTSSVDPSGRRCGRAACITGGEAAPPRVGVDGASCGYCGEPFSGA